MAGASLAAGHRHAGDSAGGGDVTLRPAAINQTALAF